MAHDEVPARTFPSNGPEYWKSVAILANLSLLDRAARVLLRFLSQLAREVRTKSRWRQAERGRAESRLIAYISEVERYRDVLAGRVRMSHRNINALLDLACRAAHALAAPGTFETVAPCIDQCHDLLLAGVARDIQDVTESLPFSLDEAADGQLVLSPRVGGIADRAPCRVTLRQMSVVVQRSKKSLEYLRDMGRLPQPVVKGPRGTAHQWLWSEVRPILEARYRRELPEVFPAEISASGSTI